MSKRPSSPTYRRLVKHPLEALGLFVLWLAFRLLPTDAASALGGWLGRTFGPALGVTRRARRNLRLALPAQGVAQHRAIVRGMWDNLGRTVAEYTHLAAITDPQSGRTEMVGLDHIRQAQAKGQPVVLATAHLANWEVMSVSALQYDIALHAVARTPNNPYAAWLLERLRSVKGGRRIPKGIAGARSALRVLKDGGVLGMLMDQKMNDGIAARFFSQPAMTAGAPAQLALRTKAAVVPVRVERTGGARFRITCEAPLILPDSGDAHADTATLTQTLNDRIESWIRARPQDWLWLHQRWPQAVYKAASAETTGAAPGEGALE